MDSKKENKNISEKPLEKKIDQSYYALKKPESLKDLNCRTIIINGKPRKFYY